MSTIFTIDARDHILLEVMAEYFNLSHDQIYSEINAMFIKTVDILRIKGIDYHVLKSCLVPSLERMEIVFVFDTEQIKSSWYGYEAFDKIIPLFDKRSSHSVLQGDFIDRINNQDFLYEKFAESIILVRNFTYIHSSQLILVYINNMSINMLQNQLRRVIFFILPINTFPLA